MIADNILKIVEEGLQKAIIASAVKYDLENSNLIKSIKVELSQDSIFVFLNSYYIFVESGRRPKTKRIPISVLMDWIKKNGIIPKSGQTIKSVAFAMQESIYQKGLGFRNGSQKWKPFGSRPFVSRVIDSIDDFIDVKIDKELEVFVNDFLF